jgi:Icc-related predicted phosphoesterase
MSCVRVAAIGDVHVGPDSDPVLSSDLLAETADLLLVAGDLTRHGTRAEAEVLAAEVATVPIPVIVVLGNHDYDSDAAEEVCAVMESAGATVLDGASVAIEVGDIRVGVAGTPGFGGGFRGASCSEFGEPLMKAFVRHTRAMADALRDSLVGLDTDLRIALTHYSPIESTLEGERLEIYPFLGSYLLAEAIDAGGAHLAIHGHAHRGSRAGVTPGGVPVRNVARPVLGRPFTVLRLDPDGLALDTSTALDGANR